MTSVTTISSRHFNQDTASAKKAAAHGPVVITDRGHPAHVLLTYQDYQRLSGTNQSIVRLLAMPEAAAVDFEPARARGLFNPAAFD